MLLEANIILQNKTWLFSLVKNNNITDKLKSVVEN